ncbi:heme/hemin ABC transporter substrate-binding protein [Salipiger sp.]|uniref:heme/hemin ABC transporter substrate-binding protein n=1 Tax=Salipiger sp. TaxID=2078585 RepID=UPI003A9830D7
MSGATLTRRAALALAGCALAVSAQAAETADVLSLGGAVTEIVYALGEQDRLVARDTTSSFPPEALALPDVGYLRALSPEGVLSVAPALILSEADAGPPEAIEVLRAADVAFVTVPEGFDAAAIAEKIRVVGAALDVPERAEALAASVAADIAATEARAQAVDTPKRVLFVLSAQGGKLMAGGQDTGADAVIRMAGGVNALSGIEGYKPLTDEAAAAAAPDVVLMMDRGGDHAATAQELFALPALAVTPAARDHALVRIDGLKLLGFGPRTAEAVSDLHRALYGD